MRILLVDDENESLRAMACFLARTNAEIVMASESSEAAQYIVTQSFDAIFLDYVMPPPNGLELAALARNSSLNYRTPIIMVTGYDDLETRGSAAETGATHFLPKPFTPDSIRGVLRAVLAQRKISESGGDWPAREFAGY